MDHTDCASLKMTKWQRGILMTMFLLTVDEVNVSAKWVPRRSLEHLMRFDWQGSHTAKVKQLVDCEWLIRAKDGRGLIVYQLTPAARQALANDAAAAYDNLSQEYLVLM